MTKGWRKESVRHSKSANGIKTGRKAQAQANMKFSGDDLMFPKSSQESTGLRAELRDIQETKAEKKEQARLKKEIAKAKTDSFFTRTRDKFEDLQEEAKENKLEREDEDLVEAERELAMKETELHIAKTEKRIKKIDKELEKTKEPSFLSEAIKDFFEP